MTEHHAHADGDVLASVRVIVDHKRHTFDVKTELCPCIAPQIVADILSRNADHLMTTEGTRRDGAPS